MQDAMNQRDGVAVGLGCGHPGVIPGAMCPLCGAQLPFEENKNGSSESQSEGSS